MLVLWLCGFLSSWIIAFIVWRVSKKNLMNRWLAALFFAGGIGPFNYFFGDLLLPQLDVYVHFAPAVYQAVWLISCVLSAVAHYFTPYCFHMFALAFSGVFAKVSPVTRRLIYAADLVPMAVMFAVIPVYPHEPIHFVYLLIWIVPTAIATVTLMTVSFFRERISSENTYRLLVWFLSVPLALTGLYTSYITRALGYAQIYRVAILIPIILFVVTAVFLFNSDFARKLLGWKHSGFSIESNTRVYDDKARECLCQYIVRAPVSLEKLYWDSETDTVLWHAPQKGHSRGESRYFSGLDFIARVTLHIPPKGKHLVRRYGVYSSRNRVHNPMMRDSPLERRGSGC